MKVKKCFEEGKNIWTENRLREENDPKNIDLH